MSYKILFQGKKTTDDPWLTYEFNPALDTFRKVTKSFVSTRSASYSPDGTRLLINGKMNLSEPLRLYLVNRSDSEAQVVDQTEEVRFPAWSHDSQLISYYKQRYFVHNLASGAVDEVAPGIDYDPDPFAWSPLENRLLLNGLSLNDQYSFLFEYDVETQSTNRISDTLSYGSDLVYSPDGGSVTFVHTFKNLWQVLQLTIGQSSPDTLLGRDGIITELSDPCYSPDGIWMAFTFGARSGDLWLQHVTTGETRNIGDLPGSVLYAAWRPDGAGIAFIEKEFLSKTPHLYYYSLADDTLIKLFSQYQVSSFCWSPEPEN
ncbi:MAG: TolB family protein [Calditrichia bacterium]